MLDIVGAYLSSRIGYQKLCLISCVTKLTLHGPASGSAGCDLALRGVEGSEPGGDSAGRGRLVGGGPQDAAG